MADEELSKVSMLDAFYYGARLVVVSIPFFIGIFIVWFIGYKVISGVIEDAFSTGSNPLDDPMFLVGWLICFIAFLGLLMLLIAILYKTCVDIISRSDFHFTKRDSF